MTFQQLREFCTISEYENVTVASKVLFITQPALSMTLKNIENEIGTPLFDRRGKNIYLNANGKEFYDYAKRTLAEWDAILERFRVPVQGDKLLRVCYSSDYISDYVLPSFSALNPDISITMNEVNEKMIRHFLENEIYDVAISGTSFDGAGPQNLVNRRFFRNRLVVSIPTTNPLSKRDSLSLKELAGQKFFRLSKRGEFSDVVDMLAKNEGIYMTVAQRVNYEVIKMLQRNYDFLYFITTLQAEFDYIPTNRTLVPIEGELFVKDMYLSYLEKNEKRIKPFLDWTENRLTSHTGTDFDGIVLE